MKARWAIVVCSLAIGPGARPAFSHHAYTADYDLAKAITIKGKITRVQFVNPHSWLYMDVAEGGKVVRWGVEMASPAALARAGVKRKTLSPGTIVTVNGFRSRDGSNTVNGNKILLPDGKQIDASSPFPEAPAQSGAPGGPRR